MSTFNDVVRKLLEMRNAIINKGGRVNVAKTNPSPDELIAGINSIDNNRPTIEASQGYVIITAEDFETILYWSKYYGVFPVNVPYSALSWNDTKAIAAPDYTISYRYSWKDDYNPMCLTELNLNTFRNKRPKSVAYIPSYNPEIGGAGNTWVGVPFVETVKYDEPSSTNGTKLEMKLRFTTRTSKYAENSEEK